METHLPAQTLSHGLDVLEIMVRTWNHSPCKINLVFLLSEIFMCLFAITRTISISRFSLKTVLLQVMFVSRKKKKKHVLFRCFVCKQQKDKKPQIIASQLHFVVFFKKKMYRSANCSEQRALGLYSIKRSTQSKQNAEYHQHSNDCWLHSHTVKKKN